MKKLLTILLSIAMVLCMMPSLAFAADGNVAQIGTQEYETLAEAVTAADGSAEIKLIDDANENITIQNGKTITLDLNGFTLNGGTAKSSPALTNNGGTVTVKDSSTAQTGKIKREDTGGSGSYYVILNKSGVMNIESGTIENNSGKLPPEWGGASLICNGPSTTATLNISGGTIHQDNFIAVKNDEYGTLNISNNPVISSKTQAIQNWKTANINGGTITGAVTAWTYLTTSATTTIKGGNITGEIEGVKLTYSNTPASNKPEIVIKTDAGTEVVPFIDGKFVFGTKDYTTNAFEPSDEDVTLNISAGTFTEDPNKYLTNDYVAVKNDTTGFFEVKSFEENVKPSTGTPSIPANVEKPGEMDENDWTAITSSDEAAVVEGLDEYAKQEALTIDNNAVETYISNSGLTDATTLHVQTYLEIEPTDYVNNNENIEYTVDITPMMQYVVSTVDDPSQLTETNSVVIESSKQTVAVKKPVAVKVQLPSTFSEMETLYVKHFKEGKTYVYTATVDSTEDGTFASFINPHGFSEFTFTAEAPTVSIGDTSYADLQSAINDVKDGEKIEAIDGDAVVNKEITFKVNDDFNGKITAGNGFVINYDETTHTYTVKVKEASGDNGGGSTVVPKPDKTVDTVKDLITAIGDVTLDDKAAIEVARAAYDKLTEAQKAKVDNYDKLVAAEKRIVELEEIERIKGMKLAARSLATKAPSGKKAIRIQWYESKDGTLTKLDKDAFDKVEIYRSTKKGEFGTKPIYTSKSDRYYNTSIKKGKRYYYKVVGIKTIGDEEVRTEMSLMAIRTAK